MTTKKQNKKITAKKKTFIGTVLSNKMQDTLVVSFDYKQRHPIYKKILKKRHKIFVQDNLKAEVGDLIQVQESRPLSKKKSFISLKIIKSVKDNK